MLETLSISIYLSFWTHKVLNCDKLNQMILRREVLLDYVVNSKYIGCHIEHSL